MKKITHFTIHKSSTKFIHSVNFLKLLKNLGNLYT